MLLGQTEEITISLQHSASQYNTLYCAVIQIRIPSPDELYHPLNIKTLCILPAQYIYSKRIVTIVLNSFNRVVSVTQTRCLQWNCK
jgi:hypothetical protein